MDNETEPRDFAPVEVPQVPTQDPYAVSRRMWSGALALLAAITADPTVQQALHALLPSLVPAQYVPVASAILAAMLAWRSKAVDPRPVSGR